MFRTQVMAWLCVAICVAQAAQADPSGVCVITSSPILDRWVANGATEYRMDVVLDSTGLPAEEIVSAEWDVVVPSCMTVTRAELPSDNDFFEGWDMEPGWNRVDATVYAGELTDNVRLTADGAYHGPSNTTGILGCYYFIVSPDAVFGESSFEMNGVRFYNPSLVLQPSQHEYLPFLIVPDVGGHHKAGDADRDGDVDLDDFVLLKNNFGTGTEWGEGDFDLDRDVDLDDFVILKNNFGSAASIPEPGSLTLLALAAASGALGKRRACTSLQQSRQGLMARENGTYSEGS